MRTRHAVVTGGAGFIGSHLVDALLGSGYSVTVIDDLSSGSLKNLPKVSGQCDFRLIISDICGDWSVPARVDVFFNLASLASPPRYLARPVQTMHAGSFGMQRVIDAAIHNQARLVQASTSEIYGEPAIHPQLEDYWGNVNPIGPRSVYDEAKRFSEALISAHVRLKFLDAGIVRIFNTYGPRLHPSDGRVIPNLIGQALAGSALTIYGDGSQTRSFCYIDDVVSGLLAMAGKHGEMGPINLGNPHEISIRELADLIASLTGHPRALVHRSLPIDDPSRRSPDITRAEQILNWRPTTDLRDGLEKTISWFRNHPRSAVTAGANGAVRQQNAEAHGRPQ